MHLVFQPKIVTFPRLVIVRVGSTSRQFSMHLPERMFHIYNGFWPPVVTSRWSYSVARLFEHDVLKPTKTQKTEYALALILIACKVSFHQPQSPFFIRTCLGKQQSFTVWESFDFPMHVVRFSRPSWGPTGVGNRLLTPKRNESWSIWPASRRTTSDIVRLSNKVSARWAYLYVYLCVVGSVVQKRKNGGNLWLCKCSTSVWSWDGAYLWREIPTFETKNSWTVRHLIGELP